MAQVIDSLHPMLETNVYSLPSHDFTNLKENEIAQEATMIYPNPASEKVFVEPSFKVLFAEIFDLKGTLLKIENIEHTNEISVADLAPGIYLLRFTTRTGGCQNKKLVVQRL
jgi:hypothetical protein